MKVVVFGADGYLGWPLTLSLLQDGHEVVGVDALFRRRWVCEMGSISALPIADVEDRSRALDDAYGKRYTFYLEDICNYAVVKEILRAHRPSAVVHLGQCPSAPYSMKGAQEAIWVQQNNLISTLNLIHALVELHSTDTHIIKLGTMGEYGTPNIDIPEGFFEIQYAGRQDRLPFPKQANSWYHLSKVHDSHNLIFACKNYSLTCTDIMQGVVFGNPVRSEPLIKDLLTRCDFDQCFGTVVNRFCCQAVLGIPITPYGRGTHKRSFLPIDDSIRCIQLALDKPPDHGDYRVLNQFANVHTINSIATLVCAAAGSIGLSTKVENLANPRKELDDHYFNPSNENLRKLGYRPSTDFHDAIVHLLQRLTVYRERIEEYKNSLVPTIKW